MYCGVSIWSRQKGLGDFLMDCKELKLIGHSSLTNPNSKTYTANYQGFNFSIPPSDLIRMRGSLHKLHNGGLHNYDDFNISKLRDTIKGLKEDFNIDPTQATIHSLEFGFNIILPYNPDDFLEHLLSFKGNNFNDKYNGHYKECELHQFFLKFYNKGLQYRQPNNILRIEMAISKMAGYKGGALVLSDLLLRSTWETSFEQLLDAYHQIIMDDIIDKTLLSSLNREIYEFGVNPNNWSNKRLSSGNRYKKKKLFNPIIEKYGQCQYKEVALALMKEKYEELLQSDILTF